MSKGILVKEAQTDLRTWEPPNIDKDSLFIPGTPTHFMPMVALNATVPSKDSRTDKPATPVEKKNTTETSSESEHHPLPTVQEIEELSRAAYEEGFERGQQEGKVQGLEQGRQSGLEQGLAEGRAQGHREGLDKGLAEGRAQGHQEGFTQGLEQAREQGYREGVTRVDSEAQDQRQRLSQILAFLEQPLEDINTQVEEQLVTLAIAIARQLIRRELRLSPDAIIPVVREALTCLPAHRRHLRLFLHPEDVPLIRASLGEGERTIRLIEDPALTRGGCRVETDTSRIDGTVEQRLNQVITRLLGGEREGERLN